MQEPTPLHRTMIAGIEAATRADFEATGSSSVAVDGLGVPAEIWRKAARDVARSLSRPVKTTATGGRLYAVLTDWPSNAAEMALQRAILLNAAAAET